jgi:endonuclease-3
VSPRKKKHAADAKDVRDRLAKALPEPRCELDHDSAWQLLIATILSAQSTDARVNMVTPALFKRFATPKALGSAELPEVEELVRTTGFFRNKAKNIVGASKKIADEHGGQVPRSLEALVELPGVARKTANVVLGTAYGLPTGFIVDTHAARVAQRLGLTEHEDAAKIEAELCAAFPKADWVAMGHRFVLHGRYVCTARKPACKACPLAEICPSKEAEPEGTLKARCTAENALVQARGT